MAICENLAHRLHAIRTERGMTITEFSELLGIARSSLQQILSGRGNPRMDRGAHRPAVGNGSPVSAVRLSRQPVYFPGWQAASAFGTADDPIGGPP